MLFFIISSMVLIVIATIEVIILWDARKRSKVTWALVCVVLPLVIGNQWAIFYAHSCAFLNL